MIPDSLVENQGQKQAKTTKELKHCYENKTIWKQIEERGESKSAQVRPHRCIRAA